MSSWRCEKCQCEVPTSVEERRETFPVRSVDIEILSKVRVCEICGSDVYDRELDSANLDSAYELYRRRYGAPTPSEIRSLREKYGLSQRGLSSLLGWGEVTIHRYEKGSVPDEAHSRILQLLQSPENMLTIFERTGDRLPDSTRSALRDRLERLRIEEAPAKMSALVDLISRGKSAGDLTGKDS